jgi:hypothetical protein
MDRFSTLAAEELQIVDAQGRPRLVLSARTGVAAIRLIGEGGAVGAEIALGADGLAAVRLGNPDPNGPSASFEIDAKGAHMRFDRPDGASSYLFLNNAGASGVVLIDNHGVRRLNAVVGADGEPKVERFGPDGKQLR